MSSRSASLGALRMPLPTPRLVCGGCRPAGCRTRGTSGCSLVARLVPASDNGSHDPSREPHGPPVISTPSTPGRSTATGRKPSVPQLLLLGSAGATRCWCFEAPSPPLSASRQHPCRGLQRQACAARSKHNNLEHRRRRAGLSRHPERGDRRLRARRDRLTQWQGRPGAHKRDGARAEAPDVPRWPHRRDPPASSEAQSSHEPVLPADVLGLFPRHRHGAGRGRVRHRCVPRGQRELLLDPDGQRGPKRPTMRPDRVCQPDPRADRVGRCFVLRTGLLRDLSSR